MGGVEDISGVAHTFDMMLHLCRLAVEAKPPQLSGHDLTGSACAEGTVLTSQDSSVAVRNGTQSL